MEYIGLFLYIYKEYVGGVDVHDDLIGVKSLLFFFQLGVIAVSL